MSDLQLVRKARAAALVTIKALERRIEELEASLTKAKETADHEFALRLRAHDTARASLATIRREALEEALQLVRGYPAVSTAPPEATDIVVGEIAASIRALMEPKDE